MIRIFGYTGCVGCNDNSGGEEPALIMSLTKADDNHSVDRGSGKWIKIDWSH